MGYEEAIGGIKGIRGVGGARAAFGVASGLGA